MKKIFLTIFILSILITGCSIPSQPAKNEPNPSEAAVENSAAMATAVPTDTITPELPTVTKSPVGEPVRLAWFHMIDRSFGWAWAMNNDTPSMLVRTEDGGVHWKNVTPNGLASEVGNVFLDSENAWVAATDTTGEWQLFHTNDGGITWEVLPVVDAIKYSDLRFFTPLEGVAVIMDGAAGSAYYTVYETTDGGKEWSLIPFLPPSSDENLPEGTLRLCNICGDIFYYDGVRSMIIKGDMASDATGKFQILTSFDRGAKRMTSEITLPAQYAAGNVNPFMPIFYMDTGTLPVNVVKYGQSTPEFSELVVYRTEDGGATWNLQPVQINIQQALPDPIHYVDVNTFYTQCGNGLCYTTDGSNTFISNPLPIPLGDRPADMLSLDQYQFVGPEAGYALTKLGEKYQFWRSLDYGLHFDEILPLLEK